MIKDTDVRARVALEDKEVAATIHEVESGHAKKISHRIDLELPAGKPRIAKKPKISPQ